MKKLIFSTIGNNNYGDESMLVNYIEKEIDSLKEIEVITIHSENIKDKYPNIRIYNPLEKIQPRNKWEKMIILIKVFLNIALKLNLFDNDIKLDNEIYNYESFTMSGGGNLNSEYIDMIIQMYIISDIFKRNNKKVYYRPQSIGPFKGIKGFLSKIIMKNILKMSDEFLVREEESYKLARTILNNVEVVKKKIDDAWTLDIMENKSVNNIFNDNSKSVAICIRPWIDNDIFTQKMRDVIEEFKQNSYKVIFVPIAYNSNIKYSDNILFKQYYKNDKQIIFIDEYMDLDSTSPKEIKYILSKVDCG